VEGQVVKFHRVLVALVLAAALTVPTAYATQSHSSRHPSKSGRANIYVIASRSFCLASGISDVYTGNGKVMFSIMLRNSGTAAGKVDITPVRLYDDGSVNQSAMDMLIDVRVPAHSRRQVNSPAYKYKAHEHEIASCGVIINNRRVVKIPNLHL
jgi:hypothetical protein